MGEVRRGKCGGSMNPYNRPNLVFLKNVMAREFDGRQAASLQGEPVWKHVDFLTVQYMAGSPGTISTLQSYHDEYLKTGKIKGLWITEDHGTAGRGPVTIVDRGLRYLSWVAKNQLDSEQTRLCWWGETDRDPGGRGVEATRLLGGFLANRELWMGSQVLEGGMGYVLSDGNDEKCSRILVALSASRRGVLDCGSVTIQGSRAMLSGKWMVEGVQYSSETPSVKFTPGVEVQGETLRIDLGADDHEVTLILLKKRS